MISLHFVWNVSTDIDEVLFLPQTLESDTGQHNYKALTLARVKVTCWHLLFTNGFIVDDI